MIETYNNLLRDFANHVGLDPQAFAKTQEVVVDGLAVGLSYDGNEQVGDIVYFTDLGAPADHRRASVYQTLLEANNLWVGTGGATLGLQPSGRVVLCGRMDVAGVSGESLAMVLDLFIDTAQYWQRFVQDEPTGDELPPPAAPFLRA